jgi:DNA repair exonuclease SbcCD nuclease subunit
MSKFCLIGDVHAVQNELDECHEMVVGINNTCIAHDCKTVVFMGDLFHNFSIINSFVLNFWNDVFNELLHLGFRIIVIKGNHDSPGAGLDTQEHGLRVFKGMKQGLEIIDEPRIIDNVQFMPHYYSEAAFIENVDKSVHTVYCHEEFNGAQYENGLYTTHGVDVSKLPNNIQFVSGHIHKQQSFNNIWYIGSPRWRSINDANEIKGIWIVDHEENGKIIDRKLVHSQKLGCKPIFLFEDSPSFTQTNFPKEGTIIIDIYGPRDYVEKRAQELSGRGYKIRPFPENEVIKIKESEGFVVAFNKFLEMFVPKNGTSKAKLKEMAMEKIKWMKV